MNLYQRTREALQRRFLGGDVASTLGAVQGEPSVGVTADLRKATGELRIHLVRRREALPVVTLELRQQGASGDAPDMACVRLSLPEAARLGTLLSQAASDAARIVAGHEPLPKGESTGAL